MGSPVSAVLWGLLMAKRRIDLSSRLAESVQRIKLSRKSGWQKRPEILLLPGIPEPMFGVAPREILGAKWWNTTRQAAYRSTHYHCIACGVYKHNAKFRQWLEAHEVYEIDYLVGRMTYVEAVPLCHCCHNYIHRNRLGSLLEKGKVSQRKFTAIIQHGERVLHQAGLEPPVSYDGPMADWSSWRLVLNGKEYPPKYETPQTMKDYYNGGGN